MRDSGQTKRQRHTARHRELFPRGSVCAAYVFHFCQAQPAGRGRHACVRTGKYLRFADGQAILTRLFKDQGGWFKQGVGKFLRSPSLDVHHAAADLGTGRFLGRKTRHILRKDEYWRHVGSVISWLLVGNRIWSRWGERREGGSLYLCVVREHAGWMWVQCLAPLAEVGSSFVLNGVLAVELCA